MHPRNFIGITLPEDLSQQISAAQRELLLPGKVMEPLVPHITILPPNCLETIAPSYLLPEVKKISHTRLPIIINLGKTALFDRRTVYINVESPELHKLYEALIELLPDKIRASHTVGREFVPHVTLAQTKPKQTLPQELIDEYEIRMNPLLPRSFTTEHLTHFTHTAPRRYRLQQI